ncbi:MAG: hypothetical protein E5W56_13395 [Mesorhizobium sp.]|nr:MAG: hypothetical protein E5W56_13395 [Mesorhizobium sp.]
MERFYFDLHNTDHTQLDREGAEALRILHDVAGDEMTVGDQLKITVRIRNEKSEQIFEASLTVDSAWT